eukprot:5720019-Ditylum_brightwellii.AAC.1
MSCDLQNTYLNAKCKEKIWFVGGKECGEDNEKALVIVRALCWLRRAAVTEFGMEYYDMLCVYVENIVAVSSKARDAIQQITEVFMAKEGSVGVPERYLGADIEKIQVASGRM